MKLFSSFGFIIIFYLVSCTSDQYAHGKRSYIKYCSSCHMDDGSGISHLVPKLFLEKSDISKLDSLPCWIRNGIYNPDSVFQMIAMPDMSSIDITNIINYIANDLNDLSSTITLDETETILSGCKNVNKFE